MSTALVYVSVYILVHSPDCVCVNHMDKLGGAGFSTLICSSVVTTAVPGVPWGEWEKLVSRSGSYYIPGVLLVLCTIWFHRRGGTLWHMRLMLVGWKNFMGSTDKCIMYVRTQHNLPKPWTCLATSAVRYSLSKHEFFICSGEWARYQLSQQHIIRPCSRTHGQALERCSSYNYTAILLI